MLQRARPVLASLDILTTVAFYEEKLGFQRTFADEGYGIVKRDEILIHFWRCGDKLFPEHTSCYIDVIGIEALYAEMQRAAVIHPKGRLTNQPWGMREFAILDQDGNLIRFGETVLPGSGGF